jgi:hypothetical protein
MSYGSMTGIEKSGVMSWLRHAVQLALACNDRPHCKDLASGLVHTQEVSTPCSPNQHTGPETGHH